MSHSVISKNNCRIFCSPPVQSGCRYPIAAINSDMELIVECSLATYKSESQPINFDLAKKTTENKFLENGFLCYASHWSLNYQHFLMETFPKILTYKKELLNTCPILIPYLHKNKLVDDILNLLSIPDDNIIYLDHSAVYSVNKLYYSSYVPQTMLDKNSYVFASLKVLQDLSLSERPAPAPVNIYISRTENQASLYNNNQNGSKRILENEEEVLERLQQHGFHRTFLGSTSIKKKVELLYHAQTIIVPSGAGIMNIVFVKSLKKLIVLESGLGEGIMKLSSKLCSYLHPDAQFIRVPAATLGKDKDSPFTTNPDLIIEGLSSEI